MLLTGNVDTQSRNFYLYSPLNSERFYILAWDLDGMFKRSEYAVIGRSDYIEWENGVSNYWGNVLFQRCLKSETYRKALDDAVNDIKDAIEGMLEPVMKEVICCSIEVMETFKISKVGTVAGCIVREGKLQRNTPIRVIRDGIVIYTGKLGSLRRFKDDVKEVTVGQDCGLNIESYNDIKVGDIIEGYEQVEVKRK